MNNKRIFRLLISMSIAVAAALFTSYKMNEAKHAANILRHCPEKKYGQVVHFFNKIKNKEAIPFSTIWVLMKSTHKGDDILSDRILSCELDSYHRMELHISPDKDFAVIHCPNKQHANLYLGMMFKRGSKEVELVTSQDKITWLSGGDTLWQKKWPLEEAFEYDLSK